MKKGYVDWKEVIVCDENGRREFHYYLKTKNGDSNLALVAKEDNFKQHNSMNYRFLIDFNPLLKIKSKTDIIDWLQSFLPDSQSLVSPIDGVDLDECNDEMMKAYIPESQLPNWSCSTKKFRWSGSPWICKRKRTHYQTFCRNGVSISVNDFVFVLAEEDKRLVAYVDDMYEDAKGNKMVVVRWFHKIDEVGVDFPCDFDDREIFFSHCLQDLSVECIDGLALVLSPQHYEKFLKEAKQTQVEPFVCQRQYDEDDLKPLDITQVKGYWDQEIVKYISSLAGLRALEKSSMRDGYMQKRNFDGVSGILPRKKLHLSRHEKVDLPCAPVNNVMNSEGRDDQRNIVPFEQGKNGDVHCAKMQSAVVAMSRKDACMELPQCTAVGSQVEVFSQDSGMRGCWFRAVIIKKHKNKIKLRYHEIKDAENEANYLEEWVLASRFAVRDEMSLRMYGRPTIRPALAHNGKVSRDINVGTVVDVWWHDGWWEGIVVQREFDEELRVYFPGEKREAIFCRSDVRHSQEWIGNAWKTLKERPDLASSILSDLMKEEVPAKTNSDIQLQTMVCDNSQLVHDMGKDNVPRVTQDCSTNLDTNVPNQGANSSVLDLSKDDSLSRLKWNSSLKRKRSMFLVHKLQPHDRRSNKTIPGRMRKPHENYQNFRIPSTLNIEKHRCKSSKGDCDNFKYCTASVVPALTSLVMSM